LLDDYPSGAVKLYVLHVALAARKKYPDLFVSGDYESLPSGEHVVAFTRGLREERLICAVPRLTLARNRDRAEWLVGAAWGEERLRVPHSGTYRNLLTGVSLEIAGELRQAELFADLPVALLVSTKGE
jgi:(1->4)-alpha-D-glucan 1-alpha-D-glucosylmutase